MRYNGDDRERRRMAQKLYDTHRAATAAVVIVAVFLLHT
jgi:hypothetical protein